MQYLKLICLFVLIWHEGFGHPLDDYVARPDDAYEYALHMKYESEDSILYVINMTSLRWMTEEFSSAHIWKHHLVMVMPKNLEPHEIKDMAYIFIGLGSNTDPPPEPGSDPFIPFLTAMAEELGAVVAMIMHIPNQPIIFGDDPAQRPRSEDDIIAYTWVRYMNATEEEKERDMEMLLYFPMTKALARTMDTVSDFAQSEIPSLHIDKFIIGGPSKRGWTTYMITAVDDRVVAMTPMVLSCLNLQANFHHHYMSHTGWSWAVYDYYREGLFMRLDTPEADEVAYLQDPYVFLDRYEDKPKLCIKAGNDEFFALDDTQFFFDDLPGVKFNMVVQNTNHFMIGKWRLIKDNIVSFFLNVYHDYSWPQFTYSMESSGSDGSITVDVEDEDKLVNVTAWYAFTADAERRDFRWLVAVNNSHEDPERNEGVRWYEDEVEDLGEGRYRVTYEAPEEGWIGFFISMVFEGPDEERYFTLTSEPNVVPNTFPVEDCVGTDCHGIIV